MGEPRLSRPHPGREALAESLIRIGRVISTSYASPASLGLFVLYGRFWLASQGEGLMSLGCVSLIEGPERERVGFA